MKELIQQLTEVDLNELILQLEKDLQMSGHAYQFKATHPNELIGELTKELKRIDQSGRLDSLFYRIDLDPNKLEIGVHEYEKLSMAIWKRTFQKVWTRKNYNSSKNT